MITKVPEMIEYISKYMTLNEGDLLFTGTPATGVGKVKVGDKLHATLSTHDGKKLVDLKFDIKPKL